MTALALGQQGSQAVGSGFESLLWQISLRFIPNIFRYPEFVIQKRVPLRFFRHCETKQFWRKILILPLLNPKIFRYRKFSETQQRRVPLGSFPALWDKKRLTENRDTPSLPYPPPLIHKIVRYQKFRETQGFPYEVLRYCETRKFL